MKVQVYKVNAFTNKERGGNGAGVVLDADSLTDLQMQEIARLVGYSETVFVKQISNRDFRFRFFTPTDEVDLCGHGTIAACQILQKQSRLDHSVTKFRVIVNVGDIFIEIDQDGKISLELEEPVFGEELDIGTIASILGIEDIKITSTGLKPQVVSVGTRQLIVPIADFETLNILKPNMSEMTKFSIFQDTMGMHIFTLNNFPGQADAACRSFDPKNGIDEESATGGACGALGYYLANHTPKKADYVFLQGLNMPNPSKLYVTVSPTGKVKVGGFAIETSKENYNV